MRAIRGSYSPGLISQRDLAELFGVTQQMIARILTGRAWAHVS
ncbi:helix-turn-helix domain-containing protein [Arthrobacter sp. NamB2]